MFNCINLIKISFKLNKKGFIIKNNNKNMNIIRSFMKIGLIKFVKIDDVNLVVYLNYFNNKPIFSNIENLFKPGDKKFISLKNLIKFNKKGNLILIISTNKGLLNSFEACNLRVGGMLIAKLWN